MGFSKEWEEIYQRHEQDSVWPWSNLVSLAYHYGNLQEGIRVLELGCGAGANIPFFLQQKADYFAVDGSATTVERLQARFAGENVHIAQADFTKQLPWKGPFDLIVDRAAVTHNATSDIEKAIVLVMKVLKQGGRYLGMDWFSTRYEDYMSVPSERVDDYTCVFTTGDFAGDGRTHFSDESHLRELFAGMRFLYLTEKMEIQCMPSKHCAARWDFVVEKTDR